MTTKDSERFTLLDLKIIHSAFQAPTGKHPLFSSIDVERVINKVRSRIKKLEKELKDRNATKR
jgi:hypothetical protein